MKFDAGRGHLAPPKVLESIGRQLGIPNRVLDIAMVQVSLKGACIVPLVGQGEATGVPKHMRVNLRT
jgi:hypothetical protein